MDLTILLPFIATAGVIAVGYLVISSRKNAKPKPKKPDKKKDKAMKGLKEIKVAATPPENIPAAPPTPPATNLMEQFPVPKVIAIELTRLKEGTNKRATTRKGRVTLIPRFGGGKDIFFFYVGKMGYFIDPARIIEVKTIQGKKEIVTEKLVYDVFNTEPLDENGNLTWSWDVEKLQTESALDQYITVATLEGGFELTRGLIKSLIVVAILGTFIGLAINGTAGLTPHTIIHYVP